MVSGQWCPVLKEGPSVVGRIVTVFHLLGAPYDKLLLLRSTPYLITEYQIRSYTL